jgi:hypothetical protein
VTTIVLAFGAHDAQHARHRYKHHPECRTARCARHADRLYAKHHPPPKPAMSALEACIIREESGGDPTAVNGQYEGIGQWSPSSWDQWSQGRYGNTPLDASYVEQEKVLRSEGEAGMIREQGVYDGCA